MESFVVVMCDVVKVNAREPQALLYGGMSSARNHLTVLLDEGMRPSIATLAARK